ncbi:LPO_1073/Vpar_1526 family protein [Slackia isoflavoniconvertens]|uniref:LPO_1073/Vpar_1526 family protein n=1 Tax=Slackia isoflavoniconvertens TaxID=572010 RepID=UPI002E794B9C|nr:LPO_1073/Vpar_1526 family protein [Slackia isoflavoniconvertens]
MTDKQVQKAGSGSTQFQAQTIIVQQGITEERARAIVSEQMTQSLDAYSNEARIEVEKRLDVFQNTLFERIESRGAELLSAVKDPSCQMLFRKAALTAASADRDSDYEVLSELLIHRFERKHDRHVKAGVTRAVEIVDQVTDDELQALTLALAIATWTPITGDILQGLDVLDDLYDKLLVSDLPTGTEWVANLDILDACRPVHFQAVPSYEEILSGSLPGYFCDGIEVKSDTHNRVLKILEEAMLPASILLVPHQLNPGFMRVPVKNEQSIESMSLIATSAEGINVETPFTEEQIAAVKTAYQLSLGDKCRDSISERFKEEVKSRGSLRIASEWWEQQKLAVSVTPCGRALAHANAKRVYPGLPDID